MFRIPSARARDVISCANAASLPEKYSAMVVATSFADFTAIRRTASPSAIFSPARRPIFDGGRDAARRETGNFVSSDTTP